MRVVIEAVPGAGKTTLILNTCREEEDVPSLIIAYNAELAKGVTRRLQGASNISCLTFHSLCSRCLQPSRDDTELLTAIERAERGEIVPQNVPDVRRVFIDEAQDVREVYLRLLGVLGLTKGDIIVLGDRNQLVYDFDPLFPASLTTLDNPHLLLGGEGGEWTRKEMTVSYRMTRQCAHLVNSLFGTNIQTRKDGPKVEIRAPGRGGFYSGLYPCLSDVLLPDGQDILLLVDRKSGNRPLKTLLNRLSREGRERIHVHGVFDQAARANDERNGKHEEQAEEEEGRLHCGTFWSAKGLEFDTVVVLLPGCAPRNPTYVALTRSSRRLVVVLDPRDPHPSMCRAIVEERERAGKESGVQVRDLFTQRIVMEGCERDEGTSFQSKGPFSKGRFRCMDSYRPPVTTDVAVEEVEVHIRSHGAGEEEYYSPAEGTDDVPPVLGDTFLLMGLLYSEGKRRGRALRRVEDILHPTRIEYPLMEQAIRTGVSSRIVPPYVTDDSLLAEDLRGEAQDAYSRYQGGLSSLSDLFILSLACLSWDSWDHTMRNFLQGRDTWPPLAASHVRFMESVLSEAGDDLQMDVPLLSPSSPSYVRVHATSPSRGCYHFVWEDGAQTDISSAAIRAACHPTHTCTLVVVKERRVFIIRSGGDILLE